jgi:hypothetical protein
MVIFGDFKIGFNLVGDAFSCSASCDGGEKAPRLVDAYRYTSFCVFSKSRIPAIDFMPYKVLLHRDFGAPNPTPADWHASLQALKALTSSLIQDGWTFPGAVIERGRDDKFPDRPLYRLHGGAGKSRGLIAVQTNRKRVGNC